MLPSYELFISYSREDDAPRKPGDPKGWVTALRDEILADHRRFSTEPLSVFCDTSEIQGLDDWRDRILPGLRESNILLVCLSPNYFASDYCRWEFEEYAQRPVHRVMGFDSFAQVYFVEVPGASEHDVARGWYELLRPTNYTDLRPWFPNGVDALREAAVRERLAALGTKLWERIQRARRATGVPGNLRRLNPHFIDRGAELRRLHENLALGAIGVVTAMHGLGGLGKTELATAYAHSFATSYPGGLWVLAAEGRAEMLPLLGDLCGDLQIPLATAPEESADARGLRVLAELRRRALNAAPPGPNGEAACLVILDNVSEPALLAEPQLSNLPRQDWLRVVVTTREGPESFPTPRVVSLAFIPVDSLSEADAARLIEAHQPDGAWPTETAAADAAAALEIARELGGFTIAVESAGIQLALHPDLRPDDYLARLRAEGLTAVHALPADAGVAAQLQHRQKQFALVLDQTLGRLTPQERTVLEYAALLPPDRIPWPWLRALVEEAHPDLLAASPDHADPWLATSRRLEGLRLLTPGDHESTARLHRLVAAHLFEQMGQSAEARRTALISHLHDAAVHRLQEAWEHDPKALWELVPLQEAVRSLMGTVSNPKLGRVAGLVGTVEAEVGRLDRADFFLHRSLEIASAHLAANPDSAEAARDVGVSLDRLGDFLAMRGMPGDAEKALDYYERSLAGSERLHFANPDSAEAARDVSVSLNKLGDLLAMRGLPGDAEQALAYYERSLEVRERSQAADPESAQAARDVSVSEERVGDFLAMRGMPGDAENALGHYERSLEIRERLQSVSPESAQAARDVSVSLNKLADLLATRGSTGDAQKALDYYNRSLEVTERLELANPDSAQAARDVSVSLNKLADYLAKRALPGDTEKALGYYNRSLEVSERLEFANPESAQAARDVSVSLNKLADILALRGVPGDAEKALSYYERSLEIRGRLELANPESAQAARDVSVSLNKLADFLAKRGMPGDAEKALGHYERCHEVLERLRMANPESAQAARDVLVSHYKLSNFYQLRGDSQGAAEKLAACFAILDSFARAGRLMDTPMRELHAQLAPRFQSGGRDEDPSSSLTSGGTSG